MDDVVTAYLADSVASAPAPRGLPLSVQAPSRHSSVAAGTRAPNASSSATSATDAGSADDWDEAAAPVSPTSGEGDDGPPLEELEAQMHGDVVSQGATEAPRVARRVSPAADENADDSRGPAGPLPEIDELVARLPAEVRETLDELFRARFVSVKKLPRRVFSSAVKIK